MLLSLDKINNAGHPRLDGWQYKNEENRQGDARHQRQRTHVEFFQSVPEPKISQRHDYRTAFRTKQKGVFLMTLLSCTAFIPLLIRPQYVFLTGSPLQFNDHIYPDGLQ